MAATNKWQEELTLLNQILQKSGLEATIKWGLDVYTHNGKNVVGVAGFKNFFTLWFYNGVFLKDEHQVLIKSADGDAKALRQWRFTTKEEIDENLILEYIREAAQNEDAGKVWKAQKSAIPALPEILSSAFEEDPLLKTAFGKLPPYKQKEYIEHIETAKREETKKSRLEKIKSLIVQGVGLHDQYKNC